MAPKTAVSPQPADLNQIGSEQVAALFAALPLGVLGAAAGASILAFALVRLGVMDWRLCFGWAGYIAACALMHLLLLRRYRQDSKRQERWFHWAVRFAVFALLEGIGWGLMPLAAAIGTNFEIEMLTIAVTFGVAAGSIPAYSPYMPAFAAFFLPATIPYALSSIAAPTPLHQTTAVLMIVFIGAVFGLASIANRSFRQLVQMRIQTAAMADDLRRQKEIAEAVSLSKSRPAWSSIDPHSLRSAFGLTDRESDVASLLAEGRDLPSIARRLRIRAETARGYLKNVFEKTGTRRQAELVALLARLKP